MSIDELAAKYANMSDMLTDEEAEGKLLIDLKKFFSIFLNIHIIFI